MLKELIIFFILAFAACATSTSQQEVIITCPGLVKGYDYSQAKSEVAPPDFPNDLFIRYACINSKFRLFDLDGDGKNDIVWNIYYDDKGKEEAWWVIRDVGSKDKMQGESWAFLKNINKKATVVWENKRLSKKDRKWLYDTIRSLNEDLASKEK